MPPLRPAERIDKRSLQSWSMNSYRVYLWNHRSVATTNHVHFGEQYLLFKQVRDRLVIEQVYLDRVLQVGKRLNEDPLL